MMKKLIIIGLAALCLPFAGVAQDATNFSQTALDLMTLYPGGSARIQAIGGAGTALGGDISSASLNPAGLGFYNRSDVSFTPSFNFLSSDGRYLDGQVNTSRTNFNMANFGVVINKSRQNTEGFKGGSFGIAVNRVASFQNEYAYEGFNPQYDFVDYAVNAENGFDGLTPDDFSLLAYNVGLIDLFSVPNEGQSEIFINGIPRSTDLLDVDNGDFLFYDRNTYRGDDLGFPTEDDPTYQYENIRTRGAVYQTSISYGANYDDKIYFGAGLGLFFMNQDVDREYIEEPSGADLTRMSLRDRYTIEGGGINGTFGVIVRPVSPLLVGLSYTTPSIFALEQTRELSLATLYNDGEFYSDGFLYPSFQYDIKTPGRLKAGATFFLGKHGFITGEVESVDYSNASLRRPSDGNFNFDNQLISAYNSALNFRIGAEARMDMFRFRAGFAHFDDPTDDSVDNADDQFTFGAGIKTPTFYVDLGIVTGIENRFNVSPFPTSDVARIDSQTTRASLTLGFTF